MLRLFQIRLPLAQAAALDEALCRRLAADRLGVPVKEIREAAVSRRSVDARGRGGVCHTLTLDVRLHSAAAEAALARRFAPNQAQCLPDEAAVPPDVFALPTTPYGVDRPRPVVVGAGPAGLFCALGLAVRGAKPLLLERGLPVEQRARDVAAMERDGVLNPESNVLFGEGGAGAFSDGKLTCGLQDPLIRTVLETLIACGAPEDLRVAARPHVGTDLFRQVLLRLRARLLALGGEVRFGCRASGLRLKNGHVQAVLVAEQGAAAPYAVETDAVYLATGHSARDTYAWLQALGVPMQQKPFAMGVRVEHPQAWIDRAQYGAQAGLAGLPPADYKLNAHTPDGRGVYTFCMCPGGQVMNASSEPGLLNVNGMSLHARAAENANSALLVGVPVTDFGGEYPLAGVELQRTVERAAFAQFGGYRAPCQRVEDFLTGRPSRRFGDVHPSYRPGVEPGEAAAALPPALAADLRLALPRLGAMLRGFDHPDALLTGPETRSSSPVRILRDARRQSAVAGLYPLGEGAGYAGGIMSAAVDGLRAALDA